MKFGPHGLGASVILMELGKGFQKQIVAVSFFHKTHRP